MKRRAPAPLDIAVTFAVLLVSLNLVISLIASSREQARLVQCASRLDSFGQIFTNFAEERGRFPAMQSTILGASANPWWFTYVDGKDCVSLLDDYGFTPILQLCPANRLGPSASDAWRSIEISQSGFVLAPQHPPTTRVEWQKALGDFRRAVAEVAEPDDPKRQIFNLGDGTASQNTYLADFLNLTGGYAYLFRNFTKAPMPHMVSGLKTDAAFPPADPHWSDNQNPILVADQVYLQKGQTYQNHGRRPWSYTHLDWTAGSVDSINGDVTDNVLHRDGSVENRRPSSKAYTVGGRNWMAFY